METTAPDVPEVTPRRIPHTDAAGIKAELDEQGFACVRRQPAIVLRSRRRVYRAPRACKRQRACEPLSRPRTARRDRGLTLCLLQVKECLNPEELEHARELLWQHLEGRETPQTMPPQTDSSPGQRRERPVGWDRNDVSTWVEGHGCGLMTSTAHCDSMWYVRTRVGVNAGFAAAYQENDLTAAFDRMSVNLPTATGNPAVLKKAATTYAHGKLNMQELHTHMGSGVAPSSGLPGYYDIRNGAPFVDFYSIVPLWDMNQATGATVGQQLSFRSRLQSLTEALLSRRPSCLGRTSMCLRSWRCATASGRSTSPTPAPTPRPSSVVSTS